MAEKEEEKLVYELQFEAFCDTFGIFYKKGMFILDLGQAVYEPTKIIARIWIDASSLKELYEFIKEQIKEYEKKFGKIE